MERRTLLKYVAAVATFGAVSALSYDRTRTMRTGELSVSLGMSQAQAKCGTSYNCSGGGGQCGTSYSCSGGGGQCGTSYNCSGGGGRCGTSSNCSGK